MMGVTVSDARSLSLWEYEALLHHWNRAHGGEEPIDPEDAEATVARLAEINLDPRFTH